MSLASRRWAFTSAAWPALILVYLLAFEPNGSTFEKDAVIATYERCPGGLLVIAAAPIIGWFLWALYRGLVSAQPAERT